MHIGVRNKYCSACAQEIPKDQHRCYKNWDASISEMETDIILEGFAKAEQVHGVRCSGSLEMAIAPCIQPFWQMFLIGDLIS